MPRPGVLATQAVPPMWRTRNRTMPRPMPVPWCIPGLGLSAWVKGSKNRVLHVVGNPDAVFGHGEEQPHLVGEGGRGTRRRAPPPGPGR